MTSFLPQQVFAFIRNQNLLQPQEHVLVAVSGGPDSTALLHLLQRLAKRDNFTLGVAHFDHSLRGAASQADAAWVAALAASLHLPYHPGTGDVRRYRQRKKISLQAAARDLRLGFLRQVQAEFGYQKIALGHTADDQLELFLLRLFRGTGPQGLKGMRPRERGLIRPLLSSSKADILAWLAAEGLRYRQDVSNLDRRYRRNRIRLDLMPQLLEYNPHLAAGVSRLQTLLQEQEDYLAQEARRAWLAARLTGSPSPEGLSRPKLLALHPAIQKRVLLLACSAAGVPVERLTHSHLVAALHLSRRPQSGGEVSFPGAWTLLRQGETLFWRQPSPAPPPAPTALSEVVLMPVESGTCSFLGWNFVWQMRPHLQSEVATRGDSATVRLDLDRLHLPLKLRRWRPGDRLQPQGFGGTKKLQDIFVDAKVPREQRSQIPLLLSDAEIVWIVGLRQAETAKVTLQTRRILEITAYFRGHESASQLKPDGGEHHVEERGR